jgi:hypothetical protein
MLSIVLMFFAGTASAAAVKGGEAENSVNAGFAALPGLFDTEAAVFYVEFERKMSNKLTIFGRFGMLDYDFDDGTYKESGDGPGFDAGVRFYPLSGAMKDLYIGGAAGLWWTDWTYTDYSYLVIPGGNRWIMGSGDSTALKVEFEVGYRFIIPNTPVAITPNFRSGTFISLDDSCTTVAGLPCSTESEIGVYAVFGVSAGFQF